MKKLLFLLLFSLPLFAQTADMRLVGQTGRPTSLRPGESADMILALHNAGPDVARNVRVEFTATAGVRFTRISDPRCGASASGVRCLFGDFAPAAFTYTGVDYDMPFGAGSQSVTATVRTDSSDPDGSNDSHTIDYQIVPVAGVFVQPFPRARRVDPGETATFVTGVNRVSWPREPDTIPAGTVVEARFSVNDGATIERVDAPSHWSCTVNGATAECRLIAPGGNCCGDLAVTVRASDDRDGGVARLDAEGVVRRPSLDEPSRGSASLEVFRHVVVDNVQDDGPGSLRTAIGEVNERCATHSCRLLFETSGEIVPSTPLPRIVAERLLIDGAGVVLDGRVAGRGVEVHTACEGAVRGLTFRNFTANEGLWFSAGRKCESRAWPSQYHISDNVFERNRRGLILDGAPFTVVTNNVIRDNQFSGIWMWHGLAWIESNRIENNGASGVFLGPGVRDIRVIGNIIDGNREMGVAVAYGASRIEIRNRMRGNGGLGIDWGLDGVTPPREDDQWTETNAPVLLSAVYDAAADVTRVTVSLRTRPMEAFTNSYAVIDVYESVDGGSGQSIAWYVMAPHTDGTPFTISAKGDHRGKWLHAMATRAVSLSPAAHGRAGTNIAGDAATTSEFSNAVLVSP
ncbi:MAG TPA: right-handed parallel beta-helix repeat-containing protein [Thermoanaerobaculia bacterium]